MVLCLSSPHDTANSYDPAFVSCLAAYLDTAYEDAFWSDEYRMSNQPREIRQVTDEPGKILKAAAAFEFSQSPTAQKDTPTPVVIDAPVTPSGRSIVEVVTICLDQAVNNSTPMHNPGCLDVQTKLQQLEGNKEKVRAGKSGARTMMICNIPCRVSHDELVEAINSIGFGSTYEFVHLPSRYGASDSNLGYGFVHFFRKADAESFALAFDGYRFINRGSTEACTVKVADCQGRNASSKRSTDKEKSAHLVSAPGIGQSKAPSDAHVVTKAADKIRKASDANEARTMMICNIPCRVSSDELTEAINSLGFDNTYEFVHLPCRFGQSDSNLGYGFVHFFHKADAECFAVAFDGYRFSNRGSTKACSVKVADCQGRNGSNRRLSRNLRRAQQTSP